MTIPETPGVESRTVPAEVYRNALRFVPELDRDVRMDSPATQGIATGWFTESAVRAGDLGMALRYARVERAEWLVVDTMFRQWLDDILRFTEDRLPKASVAVRVAKVPRERLWDTLDGLATKAAARLEASIEEGEFERYEACQSAMRELHVATNDLYVEWIQDLLTLLAERFGDEVVEEATRRSYESVWMRRYEGWFDMTSEERLALTCAGMRAHYGGPGRRGDFEVVEEADRFVLTFDPCGTGGVLRRRAANGEHVDVVGGNREAQEWSWGLTNVPWYCSHCPMLLEHFPLQYFGEVLRPTEFSPDPQDPTRWVIPKK